MLDLGPPENPNWRAVMLVKSILTHPDVWGPTAHDESIDPEKWWPVPYVTYMCAFCEGEAIGIFTTYALHWGLWIAHTSFLPWGRGAKASAAAKKAMDIAFQFPGCEHLIGWTPSFNKAAVRSALRLGFTKDCELPYAYLKGGVWGSVIQMSMVNPRHKAKEPTEDPHIIAPAMQRIDIKIDPSLPLSELAASPQLWDADPERRNFSPHSPHREMQDIWVRYGDKSYFYKQEEPHEPHWWPVADLLPSARRIAYRLLAHFKAGELGGIWITKVPPGGQIYPHVDSGWHANHYNTKVYVVLKSNDQCRNYAASMNDVVMKAGECWSFDNSVKHWMINAGETERITMIVCMRCQ